LSTLGWQETVESKRVRGKSAGNERRQKCRSAWNRNHWHAVLNGEPDQAKTWIGYSRHPRVTDHSDALSLFQIAYKFLSAFEFVVLVIAGGASSDSEMIQQLLRLACIFAGDEVGFFQNMQRAQSDVFEIPNGSRNKVKARRERRGIGRHPVKSRAFWWLRGEG